MTVIIEVLQAFFLLLIFFALADLAHPLQRIAAVLQSVAAELKRHNDWQEED